MALGHRPTRELIALAKANWRRSAWRNRGEVMDGCVMRQQKAYPVYDDEYAQNVEVIRQEIERNIPASTWWAATACTNTTTRIMP